MSVSIRLSRYGKKFAPSFKIVVSQTRNKRDGKFIDILGYYNPSENPVKFDIDKKKYEEWVSKGAIVSDTVDKLVKGEYKFKPYKGSKDAPESTSKETTKEPAVEESNTEEEATTEELNTAEEPKTEEPETTEKQPAVEESENTEESTKSPADNENLPEENQETISESSE